MRVICVLLALLLLIGNTFAQTRQISKTSLQSRSSEVKAERVTVTVNLKDGSSLVGKFIGANETSIQIEVAKNKLET